MAYHPYQSQSAKAFWSRSVANDWSPSDLVHEGPILSASSKIMSAGSCFAANIVPHVEAKGLLYVRTERVEDGAFGYGRYSAAYGNVYTPRQWLQTLQRALGSFRPRENRWVADAGVVDPFRPGLANIAEDEFEFDALTRFHLDRVLEAVAASDTFIFTLGLTEAWLSRADGAVFPACPGTVAGSFSPEKHAFYSFSAGELVDDLLASIDLMRTLSGDLKVILTVSPVPLVATATEQHVYRATSYSKAALRVAAEEVCRAREQVIYFPAYEIVTGPFSEGFFASDRRTVTPAAIDAVLEVLFAHSEIPDAPAIRTQSADLQAELSKALLERECEEMMADQNLKQRGPVQTS